MFRQHHSGHKMLFNPNPTQCFHLGSLSHPGLSPDDSYRRSSSGTMRVIDHSSTSETLRTRLPGLCLAHQGRRFAKAVHCFLSPCMSCIGMMRTFRMEKRIPISWVRTWMRMRCTETNDGRLRAIAVAQCPDWPDNKQVSRESHDKRHQS